MAPTKGVVSGIYEFRRGSFWDDGMPDFRALRSKRRGREAVLYAST